MNPDELRTTILHRINAHEQAGGSGRYLEDSVIADSLGAPVEDVRGQLEILEQLGYVDLVSGGFGSNHGALLTPKGRLALEAPPKTSPRPPVGF